MAVSVGGRLLSKTMTEKFCVTLRWGEPLSVTMIEMEFEPGPCVSVGVQVNTPLLELMAALVGAFAPRLNVKELVGISGSLATFVMTSAVNSKTVRLEMADKNGGRLLSSTMTEKLCVVLRLGEPLSVTMTEMKFEPGPCASVGVQVNTPVL